jgi:rSAM/selenodomain-associated transferase 2
MAEISIIIPTLNEEAGIISFLIDLQPLRTHCELIVVDGGSDDNTVMLAESYVDVVIKSGKGRAMQMNAGAAAATAPILLFLHADTQLPDDAIEKINFAREQGYVWGRFDVTLTGNLIMLNVVAWLMNTRSRWTGIATGDQAIFVKKTVFDRINGFANIALMEDIDLSTRLKQQGKPCCVKSKVTTSGRRWIQFGIVKTIGLMWWLRLRYFFGAKPEHLAQLYRKGRFWKV